MQSSILAMIKEHRLSSTDVADALGKEGAVDGLHALNSGCYAAGVGHVVYANDESNWHLHRLAEGIPDGAIVFVAGVRCGRRALFGELVAEFILKQRRAQAIVVDGLVRDAHAIKMRGFPVWSQGVTPVGCYNTRVDELTAAEVGILKASYEGKVFVCDDSGVVVVSSATPVVLANLDAIGRREQDWFRRVRSGESTFSVVCEAPSNVQHEPTVLPERGTDPGPGDDCLPLHVNRTY